MLNRRVLLALAASSALMASAQAQDWKAKYPELVFASIPDENAAMVTERYTDFVAYLCRARSAFRSSCVLPVTTPR